MEAWKALGVYTAVRANYLENKFYHVPCVKFLSSLKYFSRPFYQNFTSNPTVNIIYKVRVSWCSKPTIRATLTLALSQSDQTQSTSTW